VSVEDTVKQDCSFDA